MRDGFPDSVVLLLLALFVLSLVALVCWVGYFVSDAAFFGRPGALGGLWLTAVLSGSVALFSGLLAFHYEHEDYTRGEEVFYRTFLIVSTGILLCSGLFVALIYVFG
ncbi:MAG TPA: hypothetical protein VK902_07095 [Rubrobacter sp.]|nr:hypothetical protein [Rubrobacter sp.]